MWPTLQWNDNGSRPLDCTLPPCLLSTCKLVHTVYRTQKPAAQDALKAMPPLPDTHRTVVSSAIDRLPLLDLNVVAPPPTKRPAPDRHAACHVPAARPFPVLPPSLRNTSPTQGPKCRPHTVGLNDHTHVHTHATCYCPCHGHALTWSPARAQQRWWGSWRAGGRAEGSGVDSIKGHR